MQFFNSPSYIYIYIGMDLEVQIKIILLSDSPSYIVILVALLFYAGFVRLTSLHNITRSCSLLFVLKNDFHFALSIIRSIVFVTVAVAVVTIIVVLIVKLILVNPLECKKKVPT